MNPPLVALSFSSFPKSRSGQTLRSSLGNEKGVLTILVLIFTPLLLTLFFAAAMTLHWLKTRSEESHLCRTTLLASQQRMAEHYEELLSYNPMVRALRAGKAIADLASSFPNPVAILVGNASRISIQSLQKAIALRQKYLVAKIASELILVRTKYWFQQRSLAAKRESESGGLWTTRTWGWVTSGPKDAQVVPDTVAGGPAIYRLQPDFSRSQELHASWRVSVSGDSIQRIWPTKIRGEGTCHATIEYNGKSKFKATLSGGQPLLSSTL